MLRTGDAIEPGGDISHVVIGPGGGGRGGSDATAEVGPVRLGGVGFAEDAVDCAGLGVPGELDSIGDARRGDGNRRYGRGNRCGGENALARVVIGTAGIGLQSNGSEHVSVRARGHAEVGESGASDE